MENNIVAVLIIISVIVIVVMYKAIQSIHTEYKEIHQLEHKLDNRNRERMRIRHNREVNQYLSNIKK